MGLRRKFIILGVVVCGIGLFEYLNFSGFCYRERRYLRDEDLLNIAVRHAIARIDRIADHVTYNSIEEFYAVNPNCCRIYKEGHWILPEGIWVRAFGWYVSVARVWYKVKEASPRNFYDALISLDACGKVLQMDGTLESIPPTKL